MLDRDLQQRFASRCTDAALGYSAASTAAYAAFADQVLNFWSAVLQPPAAKPPPASQLWNWPVPMAPPAPPAPVQSLQPIRLDAAGAASAQTRRGRAADQSVGGHVGVRQRHERRPQRHERHAGPPARAGHQSHGRLADDIAVRLGAGLLADGLHDDVSGVPHTVAWPTAEANAAVLDAADAATQSIKKVFASYHTEGGHASSHGTWPPTEMLTLMAMVPLNVGTMFTALRMP